MASGGRYKPGSSPLTRGKRRQNVRGLNSRGLIPAHAGKTLWGPSCSRGLRAHPRSRGENRRRKRSPYYGEGSSPLTRGKRPSGCPRPCLRGLIPAHAGKTNFEDPRYRASSAHPRSRGENGVSSEVTSSAIGSSPLTRGKRVVRVGLPGCRRLIPAHAGKTPRKPQRTSQHTAHPRSRGENLLAGGFNAVEAGSSPLTRGKRTERGAR